MPKITLFVGPSRVEIENGDVNTVADLFAQVANELNIPTGTQALVNGAAADEDTQLTDGDEVSFNKPAGEKGN